MHACEGHYYGSLLRTSTTLKLYNFTEAFVTAESGQKWHDVVCGRMDDTEQVGSCVPLLIEKKTAAECGLQTNIPSQKLQAFIMERT